MSDVGGLLLIIPFEAEIFLSGLLVAELGLASRFSKPCQRPLARAAISNLGSWACPSRRLSPELGEMAQAVLKTCWIEGEGEETVYSISLSTSMMWVSSFGTTRVGVEEDEAGDSFEGLQERSDIGE